MKMKGINRNGMAHAERFLKKIGDSSLLRPLVETIEDALELKEVRSLLKEPKGDELKDKVRVHPKYAKRLASLLFEEEFMPLAISKLVDFALLQIDLTPAIQEFGRFLDSKDRGGAKKDVVAILASMAENHMDVRTAVPIAIRGIGNTQDEQMLGGICFVLSKAAEQGADISRAEQALVHMADSNSRSVKVNAAGALISGGSSDAAAKGLLKVMGDFSLNKELHPRALGYLAMALDRQMDITLAMPMLGRIATGTDDNAASDATFMLALAAAHGYSIFFVESKLDRFLFNQPNGKRLAAALALGVGASTMDLRMRAFADMLEFVAASNNFYGGNLGSHDPRYKDFKKLFIETLTHSGRMTPAARILNARFAHGITQSGWLLKGADRNSERYTQRIKALALIMDAARDPELAVEK